MGYVFNHLATLVCGVFAAVLTLLWPMFVDYSAVFDLVFMLAVPIMWFLTIVCFVAQKSADYMHSSGHKSSKKSNKKLVYTSDGIASKQNNH
jgi:ABC-type dipeptide/oligopeptide/nickel transport system permease component